MFKVIATDVVISNGYDGAPALKFSENGESVRFRIGKKVYDTRAENNTRWVNLSAKAFGPVCERIKKMQLKESSFINILGRLDEDVWEDSTTHEKRSAMVVINQSKNYKWIERIKTHMSIYVDSCAFFAFRKDSICKTKNSSATSPMRF